jgi:hypothetical protein
MQGVVAALGILAQKNKDIEMPVRLAGKVTEEDGQTNRRELAGTLEAANGKN